jgi:hypothetical protein
LAAAFAQTQTPIQIGNIWNWQDHQPTKAQVQREEKAAGIAPTPSQRASDLATLRQIYRQLLVSWVHGGVHGLCNGQSCCGANASRPNSH